MATLGTAQIADKESHFDSGAAFLLSNKSLISAVISTPPGPAALDARLKNDGREPGTVNHYMKRLISSFAWAIDQGYHPGPNPARAGRPYVIDQKRRAYSPAEVERILAASHEIELEAKAQDGAMRQTERTVWLQLQTSIRADELLNLKGSSVHVSFGAGLG